MPYIRPEARRRLDPQLNHLAEAIGEVGELTYALTKLCLTALPGPECYHQYALILGALESTKLELYRRRVAIYENVKADEHGDVY